MTSKIIEPLKELSKQAYELRPLVVSAFEDRDKARPLITEREGLKNKISETVSRIQPDASGQRFDTAEVAEYRKQRAELTAKVEALYAPLTSLGESCNDFVRRVVSTLQFVPREGNRICKGIAALPMLRRGLGPTCADACGDLEALSFHLDELIAFLEAIESNRSKAALGSAPVTETDSVLRNLKLESGHTWETIAIESGISVRRLYEISNGVNTSSDTRAKLSACFSRLLKRPVQF